MDSGPAEIGTVMDLNADALRMGIEFRKTHDIKIVQTRDGLRFAAERKPGAQGPHSLIGTAGEIRHALRGR